MARLPMSANTSENNEGLEDYTPIPAGDVIAQITKSQYKATKKKDGNYLQLIWKVVAGKFKGRTLFDNLNLDNPNPIAVEIANKALNSICKACEKVGVQDSEELHGTPCKLSLSVQKETSTNPASNNIRGYSKATIEDLQGIESVPANMANAIDSDSIPAQTGQAPVAAVQKKLPWES